MGVVNHEWTETQVLEIIERWNRNESTREIAAAMSVRKNQIAGKLNRLYRTHAALITRGRNEKLEQRREQRESRVEAFMSQIRFSVVEPDDDRVYVTRVQQGQCRYPIDAPDDAAFSYIFCAKETEDEKKCYCAQHHAMTHWKEARPLDIKHLLRIR